MDFKWDFGFALLGLFAQSSEAGQQCVIVELLMKTKKQCKGRVEGLSNPYPKANRTTYIHHLLPEPTFIGVGNYLMRPRDKLGFQDIFLDGLIGVGPEGTQNNRLPDHHT